MYGSSDIELSHLKAKAAISDFAASVDHSTLASIPSYTYEGEYEDTYGAAGVEDGPKETYAVEEVDEAGKKRALIGPWQAGWNITNAIQVSCMKAPS
ncbi:unnamed protein product [Soboliphyme baturini]|uniref:Aldedh domain-containing protein n=1 Tax=Soboliphyme baturini TaxID=241478 RepID=A0A183IHP3_9BILA|nr:unnamed protein product [Soboliphyme baturini]